VTKGQTMHEEIAAGLRERILSGDLTPGDRAVSSLDAAAAEHNAAVGTIREALRLLADEGLVVTRPGIGSFVAASKERAAAAGETGSGLAADVRKLQEDVAILKAEVSELQSQRNMSRTARKRERGDEQQSG
jgi:DNA-binding GntR family transcriptional regulator